MGMETWRLARSEDYILGVTLISYRRCITRMSCNYPFVYVAAQLADRDAQKQSGAPTEPDPNMANLPSSPSEKDEPLSGNRQKDPGSMTKSTLRRRTAAEGVQPKTGGTEHQDTSMHEPAAVPALAVALPRVSSEPQPVPLPPLHLLELTVRMLIPLRLPLTLLLALTAMSLLALFYFYAYTNRPHED
ncbi:uncharacterized protein [Dermacentor andersoni]|uniref:uncharacterized protein n=1 Tax=Dermacentor andersoni TaxID=34620 RepID=UPI00241634F0|nr:uncharacterized protein LOC126544075 [Dermacentor andersoni]